MWSDAPRLPSRLSASSDSSGDADRPRPPVLDEAVAIGLLPDALACTGVAVLADCEADAADLLKWMGAGGTYDDAFFEAMDLP
jgi:hypothetical protein